MSAAPPAEEGDLLLVATFARPRFEVASRTQFLVDEALYAGLLPFGARLDQLKRSGGATPADTTLEFSLLNFRLQLRLFVDRLEVYGLGTTEADHTQVFLAAAAGELALRKTWPDLGWKAARFEMRLHTSNQSPVEFIKPYTGTAPDLGTLLAQGSSFYFSPSPAVAPGMGGAGLVLEPSEVMPGGLFLRLWMTWSPVVGLEALGQLSHKYAAVCSERLGVKLLRTS